MSLQVLAELIHELPGTMREQIEGYANSIRDAGEEIFRNAGIAFDEQLLDEFILVVGIRRLWTLVDSPYWLLQHSINTARKQGANGFTVGGAVLESGSPEVNRITTLRQQFQDILITLQLSSYLDARSLRDVLKQLHEERHGR